MNINILLKNEYTYKKDIDIQMRVTLKLVILNFLKYKYNLPYIGVMY